jgi:lysozyme
VARDARYVENRRRARKAGLLTGSYHYLYPEPAPEEQVIAFYEALAAGQGFGDELPPVVDVEQVGLWGVRVRGLLEAFAELWDRTVMIYTSRSKWHALVGRDRGWALAHPLWVADWGEVAVPRLPTPWKAWAFWQTTSKGQVPGYVGNVDLDLFNGTKAELRERYRANGREGDMTEEFQFPPAGEGMNRWLERAVPGTGKVYVDLDETSGRIMVWADAPGDLPAPVMEATGIVIRVVDDQLLVQAVADGGG